MPQNSNSVIQFFNVPWDSGYRNLRHFDSASARDSYFDSLVDAFNEYPDPNYDQSQSVWVDNATPIKYGVPYVVSKNWDTMHLYNYCRYKNRGYANAEWQYCFVTGWEYVSQHSSRFSFVRDAWVNNIGNMVIGECFIEREHTDTVNDLPEPVSINHYVHGDTVEISEVVTSLCYILLYSGFTENSETGEEEVDTCRIDGHTYPFGMVATTNLQQILDLINTLNKLGKAENIITVLALSEDYVDIRAVNEIAFKGISKDVVRSHGSYSPKNSKCLRYPYCFCEAFDGTGNQQIFKWEDSGGTIPFRIVGGLGLSAFATLYVWDEQHRWTQRMTHQISYPFGYSVNGTTEWLAQNTAQMQAQRDSTLLNVGVQTAGIAAGAIGAGFATGGLGAAAVLAGGAISIGQQVAQLDISQNAQMAQADFVPNSSATPNGITMGLVNQGLLQFYCRPTYPSRQEFIALDNFFTRYGYSVNRIGTPSIGDRTYYFCKTNGAVVKGRCPQEDRDIIAKVLDRGVTFWNTDDIGSY